MAKHLIVSGASAAVTAGLRTIPGIVGYYGATMEVS